MSLFFGGQLTSFNIFLSRLQLKQDVNIFVTSCTGSGLSLPAAVPSALLVLVMLAPPRGSGYSSAGIIGPQSTLVFNHVCALDFKCVCVCL